MCCGYGIRFSIKHPNEYATGEREGGGGNLKSVRLLPECFNLIVPFLPACSSCIDFAPLFSYVVNRVADQLPHNRGIVILTLSGVHL